MLEIASCSQARYPRGCAFNRVIVVMDDDLYDEFGNYIGPEIESDDSGAEEENENINEGEVTIKWWQHLSCINVF